MKRRAMQIALDGTGTLYALAFDGTMWVMGSPGWDRVEDLPDAPDEDVQPPVIEPAPVIEAASSKGWQPKGSPVWCVDSADGSVVRVRHEEMFLRWFSKHSPSDLIFVEAANEADALNGAKHPATCDRETITIDGKDFEILSDTVPF